MIEDSFEVRIEVPDQFPESMALGVGDSGQDSAVVPPSRQSGAVLSGPGSAALGDGGLSLGLAFRGTVSDPLPLWL